MKLARRRPVPTEPEPTPIYSQQELRDRRRKYLSVTYDNRFDLGTEAREVLAPLVPLVAALPDPLALRQRLDEVADAVHEVVSTVVGRLAAGRLDPAAHARTVERVRDLAQRPTAPELVTEKRDHITGGTWADVLVAYAEPLSADLAAYFGRLLPGGPTIDASNRLTEALRVLDAAVRDLEQIIPEVARYQALGSLDDFNERQRQRREQERVDRAVYEMSIRNSTTRAGALP